MKHKKYAAAAGILSMAFLLVGCKSDTTGQKQTTSEVMDSQEASNEKTDIYGSVLAEYADSFGEYIGLEIRAHRQDVYYALYDIDGNGTEELVIAGGEYGVSSPDFTPWNYDLYGYDGTNVVHIFPDMEFGNRTNFSLYENGIIEVFYSSGAAESGMDFYKMGADGISAELVDSFALVGQLEGDTPEFTYFQNGDENSIIKTIVFVFQS